MKLSPSTAEKFFFHLSKKCLNSVWKLVHSSHMVEFRKKWLKQKRFLLNSSRVHFSVFLLCHAKEENYNVVKLTKRSDCMLLIQHRSFQLMITCEISPQKIHPEENESPPKLDFWKIAFCSYDHFWLVTLYFVTNRKDRESRIL